ncbi:phosphate uptake regulator PhoU [Haloquadratum walsbyi]|uniref:PhoU domain protein n=1 Tax=Haloquadratum walsbyi (strain DSM 16854 / JCM 12705 / C23) TaxID=768065 RepID=G0LLA7_HALWC|nr:phosphate uptake regulator PhoU [Haloquadratum walsbyi]CCC40713.1 PhoU domain protein [Haloquadratum walsbyi C23]
METRKVQLSGGTTYTVSLPKKWAQEHGIGSGSVLALHPSGDGSLLVEATADRSCIDQGVTVDISTISETALRQRILALHAVGFDTVTLRDNAGSGHEKARTVEETLRELSGFELLEVNEHRIKLTNLIDAQNVDIKKSVRRLRLVTLAMHRDAVSAVINTNEELAERVIDRDDEADKLFRMITRHFRRSLTDLYEVEKLALDRDELFEYYYTARQFERIADHAEKIARFTLRPDATISSTHTETLSSLGDATRSIITDAADAVLTDGDITTANTAITKHEDLSTRLTDLDRELYDHDVPSEAYVLGLLLDSLKRSAEYGINIASIAIQQITRATVDPS